MMRKLIVLTLWVFSLPLFAQSILSKQGNAVQLQVKGKPYLMLAGELGNSSATTPDDIQRIFPQLKKKGLNTVLVPVYWELFEPRQGDYDYTLIQHSLTEARRNNLKLVFLWFGTWKNSMSCYVPGWMKTDYHTYTRVCDTKGNPMEMVSVFNEKACQNDSKAFAALMRYLAQHDKEEQTVVMVQVENEIGMLTDAREHGKEADKRFQAQVPVLLTDYLQKNKARLHPWLLKKWEANGCKTKGNWIELFGDDVFTDELFQAAAYAQYTEKVAAAGKKEYPLPLYVNAALNSRRRKPGQYPSAGPLAHLIDVWHCMAPDIDLLAPDIYDKGFRSWVAQYKQANNPLFVPEIRLEDCDAVRAYYIIGKHAALGFSPFSIEDYPLLKSSEAIQPTALVENPTEDQVNAYSNQQSVQTPLVAAYHELAPLLPLISKCQANGEIEGFLLDDSMRVERVTFDHKRIQVAHSYQLGWEPEAKNGKPWPEAGGLILQIAPNEYIVSGSGIVLTFESLEKGMRVGIEKCQIVSFEGGEMKTLRYLSGDQTHQGRHVRIPVGQFQTQYIKLYEYK